MKKRRLGDQSKTVQSKKSKPPATMYSKAREIMEGKDFAADVQRVTEYAGTKVVDFAADLKTIKDFKPIPIHEVIVSKDEKKINEFFEQKKPSSQLINAETIVSPCLFWACLFGLENTVKLLLKKGADAKYINRFSFSPLSFAFGSGNQKIIEILFKHCPDILQSQNISSCIESVNRSVKSGKLDLLIDLYKKIIAEKNAELFKLYSILLYILGFHSLAPILWYKEVNEHFNDCFQKDNKQQLMTFLINFGDSHSLENIFKSELFNAAIRNWRDSHQGNIAHYVIHSFQVNLLFEYCPELLDLANSDGYTPLSRAVADGKLEVMGLLLNQERAEVKIGPKKQNLAHCAAVKCQIDILEYLDTDEQLWETDTDGYTPVLTAIANGHLDVLKWFLKKDEQKTLSSCDNDKLTLAHIAARHDQQLILAFLNVSYNDMLDRTVDGLSPIFVAAGYTSLKALQWLADNDSRRLQSTWKGDTLVHQAITCSSLQVLSYLKETAKDLFFIPDSASLTPVEFALTKQNLEVLEWFLKNLPTVYEDKDVIWLKNILNESSERMTFKITHFLYKNFPYLFINLKLWICSVEKGDDEKEIMSPVPAADSVLIERGKELYFYAKSMSGSDEKEFYKLEIPSNILIHYDLKFTKTAMLLPSCKIPKEIYKEILLKKDFSHLFQPTKLYQVDECSNVYLKLFNVPCSSREGQGTSTSESKATTRIVTLFVVLVFSPTQRPWSCLNVNIARIILEYISDSDMEQMIIYGLYDLHVRNNLLLGYLQARERILEYIFSYGFTLNTLRSKISKHVRDAELDNYRKESANEIVEMASLISPATQLQKYEAREQIYEKMKAKKLETPSCVYEDKKLEKLETLSHKKSESYESIAKTVCAFWSSTEPVTNNKNSIRLLTSSMSS